MTAFYSCNFSCDWEKMNIFCMWFITSMLYVIIEFYDSNMRFCYATVKK